jgi:hypothetical protein
MDLPLQPINVRLLLLDYFFEVKNYDFVILFKILLKLFLPLINLAPSCDKLGRFPV